MTKPFDGAALGEQVVSTVKTYVARSLLSVSAKLIDLEARIAAIPAGPKGERGEKGEPGINGKDGAIGSRGDPGLDGKAGPQGERGEQGPPGIQGKDGAPGERGLPGERGEKGETGIAGKDGAPGRQGERGERGLPGDRGEKGEPGISGKDGAPGRNGERGEKGIDGKDGRDGREGKDGRDGKDALEIDPVPVLDWTRSYPAGTWAQHANGLVKATRNTDPLEKTTDAESAGWRVIIAGVSEVEWVMHEDCRTVEVCTTWTGGAKKTHKFTMPSMLYRDVWRSDIEYTQGDTVTRDGSLWCCIVKSTVAQPGASKDWRLIAKRGNHGKDGAPGPQGPRGEHGRHAA